jgi:hypothetical protein
VTEQFYPGGQEIVIDYQQLRPYSGYYQPRGYYDVQPLQRYQQQPTINNYQATGLIPRAGNDRTILGRRGG